MAQVAAAHKEGFTQAKAALHALNEQLASMSERNSNLRAELETERKAKAAAKADSEAVLAAVRALAARLHGRIGKRPTDEGRREKQLGVRDEVMRLASSLASDLFC